MSETTTDWLIVGAKVFAISYTGISFEIIAKLTARDVVMESGNRYSRMTQSRSVGDWHSVRIRPLTDQQTIRQFRQQAAAAAVRTVSTKADAFTSTPTEETALAVETAIAKWRTAAARVETPDV
jgi:hypothetical protein